MRQILLAVALCALVTTPFTISAQEPTPAAPADSKPATESAKTNSLDTNKDGVVDAAEQAAATDADAKLSDVVKDGAEVADAVKALKDAGDVPKGLLIAALLAAIFKLLLSLMKVVGKNVAWFRTKDGKRVMKYSTLGLGAAAGLCANLFFDMDWMNACMIMLSGPGAVAIHEYTKDSKDAPPAEPPAPAPPAA